MKIAEHISAGALAGAGTFQAAGRKAAEHTVHITGKDLAGVIGSISGGVGITAAVSAVLSQMDFEAKKKDLKRFYKEEIASVLGKPLKKVRDGDIGLLAKGNVVVGEQMRKNRKARLVNLGTIFAATALAVGVVAGAAALGTGGLFAPIAAIGASTEILGGLITVGVALEFAAKAALAMVTYNLVKRPLQKIVNKLTGLGNQTAHEMIEQIHRDHVSGEKVTKEQVFAVFVAANRELADFVKQRYGKDFDELSVTDKTALADAIGSRLDVPAMAAEINAGRVKATELAFAVQGRISGVLPRPGDSPKHSALMTIKEKLQHASDKLHPHEPQSIPADGFVGRIEAERAAQQSMTQQR